jgi:hypothetical protein
VTRALLALGSALKDIFSHFTLAVLGSAITLVLSLPLLFVLAGVASATHSWGVMPIGIALLIGVLPNPAGAGMHYVAAQFARHEDPTLQDHWAGLRRYAGAATKCWVISLLITAILLVNVVFYTSRSSSFAPALQLLWLLLLFAWGGILLHVYPLLLRQDDVNVLLTFRNAVIIATSRPIATLAVLAIWLALLVLSATTGLAMVGGLALAASVQHNLLERLLPTLVET